MWHFEKFCAAKSLVPRSALCEDPIEGLCPVSISSLKLCAYTEAVAQGCSVIKAFLKTLKTAQGKAQEKCQESFLLSFEKKFFFGFLFHYEQFNMNCILDYYIKLMI